ncbi:MAG: AMP-binding protein, partial [Flavobacteriales bacterium]|nr:AMP-binding protein [Flavobacteriales bacterium]
MNPVGKDISGELFIGGDALARGYLNDKEQTVSRFIAHPFKSSGRLYKTGDVVKWNTNAQLEFLGRNDDQVKIRGHRIELGEIEQVLSNHPGVSKCCVSVLINQDEEKSLVGYFSSQEALTSNDLRTHLLDKLPEYMVPSHFVSVKDFALTTHGKVDKNQLPDLDGNQVGLGVEYVEPGNPTEETLVAIWKTVLKKETVGIKDNFFDLGGDSIKILRLINLIKKELDVEIPIGELYASATIEQIGLSMLLKGDVLKEKAAHRKAKEEEVKRELFVLKQSILTSGRIADHTNIEDVYPMSPIEIGMVYESQMGRGIYHDQMVHYKTLPDFNFELFEKALQLIVEKHSILRTGFNLEDFDREVQIVRKNIELPLKWQDIKGETASNQKTFISHFLNSELDHPFNVSKPLWRMNVFTLKEDFYCIVFQCHHAIIDGWSDAAFNTELYNTYLALMESPEYVPIQLRSSYRDHILELEVDKKDPSIEQYWREELSEVTKLEMFDDNQIEEVASVAINQDQFKKLEKVAKDLGTNVKCFSLSAYIKLLGVLNYESQITTGLVTNTRPKTDDSEAILGCFLNTIPLKIDVDQKLTNQQFVKQVHEKLLLLKNYERCSLLEISQFHQAERTTGNSFFDTYFNYVDFHVYDDLSSDNGADSPSSVEESSEENSIVLARGYTFMEFHVSLTGGIYYASAVLTRGLKSGHTPQEVVDIYYGILQQMIDHPTEILEIESCLGEDHKRMVLDTFNDTQVHVEDESTVVSEFQKKVESCPNKIGLVCNNIEFSYQELANLSGQFANFLINDKELGKGDIIAINIPRSEWVIVAMLGALKAGCAYLPIDPASPAERIEGILKDCDCNYLFNSNELDLYREIQNNHSTDLSIDNVNSNDLAYMIYTSGSTGAPKGVMIEHKSLVNLFAGIDQKLNLTEDDTILSLTTISFDIFVFETLFPLTRGIKVILGEEQDLVNPTSIYNLLEKYQITTLMLTPSRLSMLMS